MEAPARQFHVTGSHCVMPCMNAAKERARALRNSPVTISRRELSGLMVKPCAGTVSVSVSEASEAQVLDDLRRRFGDQAVMSAESALPAGPFKAGRATCVTRDGASSTLARFLAVEPGRVMLLTDSGVVYELSPDDDAVTGSVTPPD